MVDGIIFFDKETQTFNDETTHCGAKQKNTLISRITQTLGTTTACKCTSIWLNKASQTSNMPDLEDRLVTPSSAARDPMSSQVLRMRAKELFSTRKYSRLEEESAVKIQKFFRACRARREISSLARFAVVTRTHPPVPEELVRLGQDKRFEILETEPPRSRADFEMLRNVLDRWRIMENERVDCTLFGSSKIAAKSMILLKEIELLRSIELAKSRLRDHHRERANLEHLDRLARPETWRERIPNFSPLSILRRIKHGCVLFHKNPGSTRDGGMIEVETLRVARARECRSLYHSLGKENVPRIDTLRRIKMYIEGHTCDSVKDLNYLLDQEINFLTRNIDRSIMKQLKNRTNSAFFQFALNFCEFKSPTASKFCCRCGKLLPCDSFTKEDHENFPTCDNCTLLRPSKNPKILYEPYEQMLKDLRKSEWQLGSRDGVAFQIGPRVLHHLVNNIWHGKSGISEFDDLFQLRLLRFRMDEEWSLWNSILLTKREAAIHQAMTNPWELYDSSLVKRFVLRNLQAKLYFNSRITRE